MNETALSEKERELVVSVFAAYIYALGVDEDKIDDDFKALYIKLGGSF